MAEFRFLTINSLPGTRTQIGDGRIVHTHPHGVTTWDLAHVDRADLPRTLIGPAKVALHLRSGEVLTITIRKKSLPALLEALGPAVPH